MNDRADNRRFNLIKKILIFLIIATITITVFFVIYMNNKFSALEKEVLNKELTLLKTELDDAISQKETVWLTNALLIANNPALQQFVAQGDRDDVIKLLGQYSKNFKENTNFKNVKIHIIDKDLNSFVKSWSAEDYGEALDYSDAYREVLTTGEGLTTCEEDPNGLRLKGLFPIRYKNQIVGIVNFEGGLNSIKRDLKEKNIEFLYFLDKKYAKNSTGLAGAPETDDFILSQNDFDEDFLSFSRTDLKINEALAAYDFGDKYFSVAVPVTDFKGDQIGLYLLGKKTSLITEQITKNLRSLVYTFVIISSMWTIIYVFLIIFIYRFIVVPIKKNVSLLKDISQGEGDLTQKIEVKSKDEIGEMSYYFNLTFDKIRTLVSLVKKQSINLQNVGVNLSSNMTETAASINEISANIESIKNQTVNQSESVTETSATIEQITKSIENLNHLIEDQSANVTESSSAIEQMMANIGSVTKTLVKNSENIMNLAEYSETGKNGLDKIAHDISDIAEESEGLLEISQVIQNIASQTNLLSMNAAIEAAHAGDSGKGFAVVADEIRKLAETSGKQAKTVSTVLKRVKDSIEGITTSAKDVLGKFDTIQTGVNTVSVQESQIRRAMEEQSIGSEQILESIGLLNNITQKVQDSSQEMLTGSQQISEEAHNMNNITQEISNGMGEMAAGAEQVTIAVNQVNELSDENKSSIEALMKEVEKFKVD